MAAARQERQNPNAAAAGGSEDRGQPGANHQYRPGVYDLAALLPYAKSKHNLYAILAIESK
jgi:hypothetical protein